jgi:hypothetical protein
VGPTADVEMKKRTNSFDLWYFVFQSIVPGCYTEKIAQARYNVLRPGTLIPY